MTAYRPRHRPPAGTEAREAWETLDDIGRSLVDDWTDCMEARAPEASRRGLPAADWAHECWTLGGPIGDSIDANPQSAQIWRAVGYAARPGGKPATQFSGNRRPSSAARSRAWWRPDPEIVGAGPAAASSALFQRLAELLLVTHSKEQDCAALTVAMAMLTDAAGRGWTQLTPADFRRIEGVGEPVAALAMHRLDADLVVCKYLPPRDHFHWPGGVVRSEMQWLTDTVTASYGGDPPDLRRWRDDIAHDLQVLAIVHDGHGPGGWPDPPPVRSPR